MNLKKHADNGHESGPVSSIDMIDAMASWCECLQAMIPLRDGLIPLANSIGAEAIALSRVGRHSGVIGKSIVHDRHRGSDRLERSFAASVLGQYVGCPRPGSVWFATMNEDDIDPALVNFQRRRRMSELAVITLAVEDKSVDFLELHFRERLEPHRIAVLLAIPGPLSRTWARRSKGLFAENYLKERKPEKATAFDDGILSATNPARLSRAEYRVCLLIARGLATEGVRTELGISASTLRTHLRNIYAKTHTANQAELTYALMTATGFRKPIGLNSKVA